MSETTYQEKTEKPTHRKLEKARKEGNVAKSAEIPSALILLISLGVFLIAGSWMFWNLSGFMGGVLRSAGTLRLDSASLVPFLADVFGCMLLIMTPLMLAVLVAGIAGNIIQSGFLFTSEPLEPKFSKLNPIEGFKKLTNLRSIVEAIKTVFKCIFIGGIAFILLRSEIKSFPSLMEMGISDILSFIGKISFQICFYVCLALIFLAVFDFAYQRWQHEKNLRMTKQETKEEAKQAEGDPRVKGKIKQIQLEAARRRMMSHVHEADVVITNPTHLAIALKYEHERMLAPKVIAKGAGFIADRIKRIAEENDIPIVENKSLAQSLYKLVDLGEFIPINLYRAVAEVLAYVYKLKKMKNGA